MEYNIGDIIKIIDDNGIITNIKFYENDYDYYINRPLKIVKILKSSSLGEFYCKSFDDNFGAYVYADEIELDIKANREIKIKKLLKNGTQ